MESSEEPSLHGAASGFFTTEDGRTVEIRDVWASNLEEEMAIIRRIVEKYPYVAMVCPYFDLTH
jgi:CCR4-NOT transcription complex subunit 7/8